ncbi:hypothetical protein [Rhizobium laguerreae]|uniref:hypothetical protein n=1 Tax=Rhizobium laguerreae TaxID=1076926 RepID=UPI0014416BEC|nr:hypothetical protein [Rhizobium laguerreae]NKM67800.1 hypothetical protein [Rhizobium laguerreae]
MSRDNQGSWAFDPIKPGTFAVETIGFFLTYVLGALGFCNGRRGAKPFRRRPQSVAHRSPQAPGCSMCSDDRGLGPRGVSAQMVKETADLDRLLRRKIER